MATMETTMADQKPGAPGEDAEAAAPAGRKPLSGAEVPLGGSGDDVLAMNEWWKQVGRPALDAQLGIDFPGEGRQSKDEPH